METIGLKKAKLRIRIDDSEDSPEYVLDLTNTGIGKTLDKLRKDITEYQRLQKIVIDTEDDEKLADANKRLAAIYKRVVTATLGAKAWKEITAYVADGEDTPDEDMTLALSPLIFFLFEQLHDVATVNGNMAIERYLADRNGTDAI